MAWDSSRPVPWTRLMREWVVYAAVMAVIFVLFFSDGGVIGALAGLFISGPLYLLVGFVLAKFGYQRATIRQMRSERAAASAAPTSESTPGPRPRPAPTRRTSGGTKRPTSRSRGRSR